MQIVNLYRILALTRLLVLRFHRANDIIARDFNINRIINGRNT